MGNPMGGGAVQSQVEAFYKWASLRMGVGQGLTATGNPFPEVSLPIPVMGVECRLACIQYPVLLTDL